MQKKITNLLLRSRIKSRGSQPGIHVPLGIHVPIRRCTFKVSKYTVKIYLCCNRKSRAACAQSFAPWQQATNEIMLAISLTIACSRYTYDGVILPAHPVRGESHNQRNTTRKVATLIYYV